MGKIALWAIKYNSDYAEVVKPHMLRDGSMDKMARVEWIQIVQDIRKH